MANKQITNKQIKTINLTVPVIFVLAVVASFLLGMSWKEIKGKKAEEPQVELKVEKKEEPEVLGEQLVTTVGGFLVTKKEICQEDGKPVVYMFGSSSCPHCTWEHPIFEKVMAKFGNLITVHDNMDEQNQDREIYQEYSEINRGAIPFVILGCRYVKLGSGEQLGEQVEEKSITALVCKLTNNQPQKVCDTVKDLIDQVE